MMAALGLGEGLGVAGLLIAIPGLIDVLVRSGDYIMKKIDSFKNTNETLHK